MGVELKPQAEATALEVVQNLPMTQEDPEKVVMAKQEMEALLGSLVGTALA